MKGNHLFSRIIETITGRQRKPAKPVEEAVQTPQRTIYPPVPKSSAPRFKARKMDPLPTRKGEYSILHAYQMSFTPMDGVDVMNDILGSEEKEVTVATDGARVFLMRDCVFFGIIDDAEKAAMVDQWYNKDWPCSAILLASGNEVNLRFYGINNSQNT